MAASSMPVPAPPRTPSPLSDDEREDLGLGIESSTGGRHTPYTKVTFEFDNLSPPMEVDDEIAPDNNMLSPTFSPTFSPMAANGFLGTPITPGTGDYTYQNADNADSPRNPFNFTTQQYTANRGSISKPDLGIQVGKRRGHKYKHSSVSHQIFLEPEPKTPLQLPASLPIPTRTEVQKSMTGEQKSRWFWCFCHFMVAGYVQWSAHGSLTMTALSRLLFFDAAGAVACVVVDMMSNFEVWKSSSLKHPFGLERVDVLAGFGLAVFISFMGLDVLSHGIEHSLENAGSHESHHEHEHTRITPGSIDLAALLAIIVTLVSALLLKNHSRIGKAMRFEMIAGWGKVLGNPSHFMTLSCSVLLLILPFLSIEVYTWFDAVLSTCIALAMIAFGVRLGSSLATMLLMSYSGPGGSAGVREVIAEIEKDPSVSSIEEARFWQVHYGMCMANLKLRYRGAGYSDEVAKLREKLTSLIRNRLGGGYGSGGVKWEVSIQLALEKD